MLTLFFALAALVHAILLATTFTRPAGTAEWIIRALLLGLAVDNATLALSSLGLYQLWYLIASGFRYTAHAVILPLLLIAGVHIARRADVEIARHRWMVSIAWLLAAIGIAFGVTSEVFDLSLVPETLMGHTRLVSDSQLPPFATIISNVILLFLGLSIWRASGWRWLFVASLIILLVNAATATRPWGIISGNLAEIVFAVAWVMTLRRFPKHAG